MRMSTRDRLTHIDPRGLPRMVDVGDKPVGNRVAVASACVAFPSEVAARLRGDALQVAKGPVVATAIVAGTMAVKRTHELIPFCHPLPIDGCEFGIDWSDGDTLRIDCRVRSRHRTGVEMEALTGATVAALTVYDMCKALSHAIVIGPVRLEHKRGGQDGVGEDADRVDAR
ncbi:MAG TPA: cyclic pyranopterin monophosphate synthase MoaC [Xanthomonadaceae bacterium]|nr:cyclic pyranopterin monophosphate synthase MoaC [Xanthomonadaceae bacterium]